MARIEGEGGAAGGRLVLISEEHSGLAARCQLLDIEAPQNATLLWELAGLDRTFAGIHAMWTGPEISVPIDGDAALTGTALGEVRLENATSYPQAGDIALVCAPRHSWQGGPPFNLIDVGLFYDGGARLLMPMGWIMASICARVVDEDRAATAAACRLLRRKGAANVRISQAG